MNIKASIKAKTILIILFLSSFLSIAQEFDGGVFAGLVSSQVDGDQYGGYNKAGFQVGAFVNRKLTEKWGAQLELKYIGKGSRESDKKTGIIYYRSKLNYVEMPLLMNYSVDKFTFEGGIAGGVLINSGEEDESGELSIEYTKEFNKIEISGVAGFNYHPWDKIYLNFRFSYSLLPIRQNLSDNIPTIYYHQKYSFNNLMSFAIYYQFQN
ncbi:MAG: PorT family protein [Bacteroidetes bacterium]|jgi:hypothetical protein|nr:PorT family protein [Bacteroidota bacterium]MBT6685346.1 PorT family protein [Bacteroidota bacterium]MBT7145074.1 PorT family protein [Bacteroidota bacterium]MBT7492759.1 PorT family protein [Bacteroidota bacterium]